MKNNFLTIPDAPSYEINSDFVVRNKKTGRILKHTFINGNPCVIILTNEKKTSRGVIDCRKTAVSFDKWKDSEFLPVFSLQNKYEINRVGILRKVSTKRLVAFDKNTKQFRVYINKKKFSVNKNTIVNQTFGTRYGNPRVPVVVSKGNCVSYFDNMSAAARFIAPKVCYSFGHIHRFFCHRKTFIHGWQVNYLI